MAEITVPNNLIFFHWAGSPNANVVLWYLWLRRIEYAQCIQPMVLPRPDLNALGIKYRRVPLLAIGRDVYADTRLILRVLEERFPSTACTENSKIKPLPTNPLLSILFSRFNTDAGGSRTTLGLMPLDHPIFKCEAVVKDRADLLGATDWADRSTRETKRPHAMADIRLTFHYWEKVFKDGRQWIAGGQAPGTEDVIAVWPLEWALMPGALEEEYVSPTLFPQVYAWMDRLREQISRGKDEMTVPPSLDGEPAIMWIRGQDIVATEVMKHDPLGLRAGDKVRVWPTDSGSAHKDEGRLVGLKEDEVVLEISAGREVQVCLHTPRWGFRVELAL